MGEVNLFQKPLQVFCYSIAGREHSSDIDSLIRQLLDSKNISHVYRMLFEKVLEIGSHGTYPEVLTFQTFGIDDPGQRATSLSELKSLVDHLKSFWFVTSARNKLNSSSDGDYLRAVKDVMEQAGEELPDDHMSLDDYKTETYVGLVESGKALKPGYKSGVADLDTATKGFQQGTVATIAAFTGHGKSTFLDSIIYENVMKGKKCAIVSLEITPRIVLMMMECRFMHDQAQEYRTDSGMTLEEKDVCDRLNGTSTSDFIFNTVDKVILDSKLFKRWDEEFRDVFDKGLCVVDEQVLSKSIINDFNLISNLYSRLEQRLGGLDIVGWDHVGQLNLMFPDMGNIAVRNITSATKTFLTSDAEPHNVCTIFCCQTNRGGFKHANAHNGAYLMTAISDLNEVERSSSYVIFLWLSSKDSSDTMLTLMKHRFGLLIQDPVSVPFNPGVLTVGVEDEDITSGSGVDYSTKTSVDDESSKKPTKESDMVDVASDKPEDIKSDSMRKDVEILHTKDGVNFMSVDPNSLRPDGTVVKPESKVVEKPKGDDKPKDFDGFDFGGFCGIKI